ncbi:tRNA A37 threonylcarbamoyladenosine dehydratase OS=Castellaniella defragrans OX=75697 GN=HNR28_001279 PE=4 SV=1 [Castellaniella defragrans]
MEAMSDIPSLSPLYVTDAAQACTEAGCRIPGERVSAAQASAASVDLLRVAPAPGAPVPGAPIPSASMEPAPEMDAARRFGGLDRLYGDGASTALSHLHVVVAGIGGVGTWCVEALARSGVGALTLVDLDHIAESNVNRQVHAMSSTLGQSKVLAMAARVRDINPACRVRCVDDFVEAGNLPDILVGPQSWQLDEGLAWTNVLVDCTDQVAAKIAMILQARERGWPLLVCGGAGGKTDPMALRSGDLSAAAHDALLGRIRQELRKHHGYPKGGAAGGKPHRRVPRMGVSSLWFDQPVVLPAAWTRGDSSAGAGMEAGEASIADAGARVGGEAIPGVGARSFTVPATAAPQGLSCAGYGSAVTVTATMGMAAAHWAIAQGLR